MMMQMLAAGGLPALTDDIRAADEDNLQGYYELEAVKKTRQDESWLKEAPGKAVKVIYRLLADLPDRYHYRVLLMQRNLDEVLASQQRMLERRATKGANLSPEQLKKVFDGEMEKTRSWLTAQANFDWIEVPYANVIANAEREAERIKSFLELPLDAAAMAARVDQQLYRQRKE